jgi:hypothetical protein
MKTKDQTPIPIASVVESVREKLLIR